MSNDLTVEQKARLLARCILQEELAAMAIANDYLHAALVKVRERTSDVILLRVIDHALAEADKRKKTNDE